MKITTVIGTVVLLGSTIVFGWNLVLYNTTPHSALVGVEYPLCRNDVVLVQPGKQATIDAKECLVTDIKVTLGDFKQMKTPVGIVVNVPTKVVQKIHWKVPGHRDFSATIAQQANGKYDIQATYGTQLPQRLIQTLDTRVVQPINQHVVPALDRTIIQPLQQHVIQPIDRTVIQPINQNVIQPVVAIGETFENIISMVTMIKDMIPPISRSVDHVITQIDTLSHIKNGKEIVDPIFTMIEEVTKLPPHFQAILDKITQSMIPLEIIVRPSNPTGADQIKDAAQAIRTISQEVHTITGKVIELEKMLHIRVKTMAESADHATSSILALVK